MHEKPKFLDSWKASAEVVCTEICFESAVAIMITHNDLK
jgi:hypothetical protein